MNRRELLPHVVMTASILLSHIHAVVTCGAFTAEGEFLDVPELDMDRLREAWREAVFAFYLAEEKITPEVVENMRSWPHSGVSVDQSCTCRPATALASNVWLGT